MGDFQHQLRSQLSFRHSCRHRFYRRGPRIQTNDNSNRYDLFGMPRFQFGRPEYLIQILSFKREALYCPQRGLLPSTLMLGLSRRNRFLFFTDHAAFFCAFWPSCLRYFGSKHSFFFISVQAITRSFAASLTRIFVIMPFSFARPLSLFVK